MVRSRQRPNFGGDQLGRTLLYREMVTQIGKAEVPSNREVFDLTSQYTKADRSNP